MSERDFKDLFVLASYSKA